MDNRGQIREVALVDTQTHIDNVCRELHITNRNTLASLLTCLGYQNSARLAVEYFLHLALVCVKGNGLTEIDWKTARTHFVTEAKNLPTHKIPMDGGLAVYKSISRIAPEGHNLHRMCGLQAGLTQQNRYLYRSNVWRVCIALVKLVLDGTIGDLEGYAQTLARPDEREMLWRIVEQAKAHATSSCPEGDFF